MEGKQHPCKRHRRQHVDKQQDIHHQKTSLLARIQLNEGDNDLDEGQKAEGEQGSHKGEEKFVITFTNTGANPRAMVVETLHTGVTIVAMRGAWRAVDEASVAEFHFEVVGFNRGHVYLVGVPHHPILIFFVKGDLPHLPVLITRQNLRHHSGISEPQKK